MHSHCFQTKWPKPPPLAGTASALRTEAGPTRPPPLAYAASLVARIARFTAFCASVSNRCVCDSCVLRVESHLQLDCASHRDSCDSLHFLLRFDGRGRGSRAPAAPPPCVSRFESHESVIRAAIRRMPRTFCVRFRRAFRITAICDSRFTATQDRSCLLRDGRLPPYPSCLRELLLLPTRSGPGPYGGSGGSRERRLGGQRIPPPYGWLFAAVTNWP